MRNKNLLMGLALLAPSAAGAHVTLTEPGALPGAHYLAHFRVGHGCSGSPTTALDIAMPEGLSDVVPQAPAGWTVQVTRNGTRISSIAWTGGSLADETPGVFVVAMTLPQKPGALIFPATQTCKDGMESWAEMPAADGHKLKNPAPLLTVSPTPVKAPEDSMPGMKM